MNIIQERKRKLYTCEKLPTTYIFTSNLKNHFHFPLIIPFVENNNPMGGNYGIFRLDLEIVFITHK